MWDNTLQSNKEKLYFPSGSFGWWLLLLMFSYFKNLLRGHLCRRRDVLCVWILWLVLRLLYSLSTSCSTKGRICGTRILLSAIPMTSHRFWFSVRLRWLDLKINEASYKSLTRSNETLHQHTVCTCIFNITVEPTIRDHLACAHLVGGGPISMIIGTVPLFHVLTESPV